MEYYVREDNSKDNQKEYQKRIEAEFKTFSTATRREFRVLGTEIGVSPKISLETFFSSVKKRSIYRREYIKRIKLPQKRKCLTNTPKKGYKNQRLIQTNE